MIAQMRSSKCFLAFADTFFTGSDRSLRCISHSALLGTHHVDFSSIKQTYSTEIDELSVALVNYNSNRIERNKEFNDRIRPIVTHLERSVCAVNGLSRLLLIGSAASGLAMEDVGSDFDLAFFIAGDNTKRKRFMKDLWGSSNGVFLNMLMMAIANALRNERNFEYRLREEPIIISHTKVPLIIGKLSNGFCFDLQFPRPCYQAIRNTLMTKRYLEVDARFPQLYFWLKKAFMAMGLKNSKDGLFSSYHILLLVLHFLQRREEPNNVLPVLFETHQNLFPENINEVVQALDHQDQGKNQIDWASKCSKSVGELAVDLIDYYANFDPLRTSISIRKGKALLRRVNSRSIFYVFDPFGQESAFRSKFLADALPVAFQFLRKRFSEGKYIASFPQFTGIFEDFAAEAQGLQKVWVGQLLHPNKLSDYHFRIV